MRKSTLIDRLQRTKMALISLLFGIAGITLLIADHLLLDAEPFSWATFIPWGEFGGILVGAGLLGIWIDHLFKREQQAASENQLRRLLHEQAPALRDAVLEAFAADQADLERVATPDTLDQIITNSLGLRLNDKQFASEIFGNIKAQVIDARERWTEASLDVTISTSKQHDGYLDITYRWEYTTVPHHSERRFICLSNRGEYAAIANSLSEVSAWYFKPDDHFKANDKEAFELLRFAVDGIEQPIKRSARATYQQYTVMLGNEITQRGSPVTISYTTRTVTSVDGHLLFFDVEQPTRDLHISLDYTNSGLTSISAIDLFQSLRPGRMERSPEQVGERSLRVDIDGWVFPRSGAAFVWKM